MEIINPKDGVLNFGNQEYISSKTTYEEILKMKGSIDNSFVNLAMGIQSLSFYSKEINEEFYQIIIHFHFGKLTNLSIHFKNGIQLTHMPIWEELKLKKKDNHTKSLHWRMFTKEKKYNWGKVHAFYSPKVNLGVLEIDYKVK